MTIEQRSLDELMRIPEAVASPDAKIHRFDQSLQISEAGGLEPFWDQVYRKHFPTLVACVPLRGDTAAQRQGKDRAIHLANGSVLYIDEKIRPNRRDDRDILLEYLSNDRTGAPGWIEQDKAIDYLAYAFVARKRVYIFPWLQLRRAWCHYKSIWQADYAPIPARNPTYTTYSTPVPTDILRKAVSTAAIIQL